RPRPLPHVAVAQFQVSLRRVRTRLPAMHPQCVGEFVEMPVGASEQVTGRYCRATPSLALRWNFDFSLRRSGEGASGTAGVFEGGQVGPERVSVDVTEPRQWPKVVTTRAPEPLREHSRWDAEVGALLRHGTGLWLP